MKYRNYIANALLFVAIFCITASLLFMTGHAHAGDCYSEGVRVGSLQKFSKKGIINISWEGEMVMEGTQLKAGSSGGTRGGNVWKFSVIDAAVAKEIDGAMMSGGLIALRYCQTLMPMFQTDTPYRITQAAARK